MLARDWKLFGIVRNPDKATLPVVLSQEEVRRLLGMVKELRFRVVLQLIYAWLARPPSSAIPFPRLGGLRVGEAVKLCVQDIHAEQKRIHVCEAKGLP